MPYEDKIMVASGDSEHPGEEEVGFETIPPKTTGGHTYDIKFSDNSEDLTLTEDEADKTSLHLWTTIKEKIKTILHIGDNTIDAITDVYGAKNLFPTQTSYLTATDSYAWDEPVLNSNGTIDFGVFYGGTYYNCELSIGLSLPKTGDYIFTSGLTDANDSTAYIEVYKTNNATPIKVYNEPVVIENTNFIHHVILVSKDGQLRTFKPMLRLASIESNEYVPFAMTNKQLTDLAITKEMANPIGTVIHSTTCDTMAKVVATYGGTTWIQLSGYVLRGATSGVTANSNTKDGGNDDLIVPYHDHGFTGSAVTSGASSATNTGTQSANHTHTVNGGATNTGNMSANATHKHRIREEYGNAANASYAPNGTYNFIAGNNAGTKSWQGDPIENTSIAHTHSQVAHTHSVGENSANHTHNMAHTHSVTAAGTVGYAGTNGNAINANIPNYKNVYIWERTA